MTTKEDPQYTEYDQEPKVGFAGYSKGYGVYFYTKEQDGNNPTIFFHGTQNEWDAKVRAMKEEEKAKQLEEERLKREKEEKEEVKEEEEELKEEETKLKEEKEEAESKEEELDEEPSEEGIESEVEEEEEQEKLKKLREEEEKQQEEEQQEEELKEEEESKEEKEVINGGVTPREEEEPKEEDIKREEEEEKARKLEAERLKREKEEKEEAESKEEEPIEEPQEEGIEKKEEAKEQEEEEEEEEELKEEVKEEVKEEKEGYPSDDEEKWEELDEEPQEEGIEKKEETKHEEKLKEEVESEEEELDEEEEARQKQEKEEKEAKEREKKLQEEKLKEEEAEKLKQMSYTICPGVTYNGPGAVKYDSERKNFEILQRNGEGTLTMDKVRYVGTDIRTKYYEATQRYAIDGKAGNVTIKGKTYEVESMEYSQRPAQAKEITFEEMDCRQGIEINKGLIYKGIATVRCGPDENIQHVNAKLVDGDVIEAGEVSFTGKVYEIKKMESADQYTISCHEGKLTIGEIKTETKSRTEIKYKNGQLQSLQARQAKLEQSTILGNGTLLTGDLSIDIVADLRIDDVWNYKEPSKFQVNGLSIEGYINKAKRSTIGDHYVVSYKQNATVTFTVDEKTHKGTSLKYFDINTLGKPTQPVIIIDNDDKTKWILDTDGVIKPADTK